MNVPKLRFPEFEGEWEVKQLSHYMTFKNGVNADKSMYGHGRKFINVMDIIAERPIVSENIIGSVSISDAEFKKNEVVYGDILFQRSSETREETGQSNVYLDQERSATFGGFVIRGRPVVDLDPRYFDALLKTDKARKDITNRSGGSTRFNVGQASLGAVVVDVAPTLPEQKKIAAFLGVVDAKIAALRARVAGLERYKRGLMQALFSQTLRFTKPDGSPFPDWEEKRLGDVFAEVTEKVGDQDLPTYSISAGKGWVSQIEKFGKDISGQQNQRYTALRAGDFSYNKGNSKSYKYGCIYPNDTCEMIAVPNVFISFRSVSPNTSVGFFAKFFEDHRLDRGLRTLISSGARMDGLLNVNKTEFFKLKIPYPHTVEQAKIADALSAMDAKIAAVSHQLDHMQTFKKGLLQQMFV